MASTEIHGSHPQADESGFGAANETEPLLGRPGDALQKPDGTMLRNLYLGTGWLAQIGALLLLVLVWAGVFIHPIIPLFSPHPLLQSAGVFTLVEAILILQPTNTPETKVLGARAHAALQLLSLCLFAAGTAIIEANKMSHPGSHFKSAHGYLGVTLAFLMAFQYLFGFLIWATPVVFGGVDNAKALWKYHRWAGYVILVLILVTVITATDTTYNYTTLRINRWSIVVAAILVVIGTYPRIQLIKLGINRAR